MPKTPVHQISDLEYEALPPVLQRKVSPSGISVATPLPAPYHITINSNLHGQCAPAQARWRELGVRLDPTGCRAAVVFSNPNPRNRQPLPEAATVPPRAETLETLFTSLVRELAR